MFYKMLYRKYRRKFRKQKQNADRLAGAKRLYRSEVARLRKRVALLEDGYVVAWCIRCESQVVMLWDVEKEGCSSYCPHCGSRMMLCDSCQGECDYDYGNDTCKEM